jgi:hypothetical protein
MSLLLNYTKRAVSANKPLILKLCALIRNIGINKIFHTGHPDVLAGLVTKTSGVTVGSSWLEEGHLILPLHLVSPIQPSPQV